MQERQRKTTAVLAVVLGSAFALLGAAPLAPQPGPAPSLRDEVDATTAARRNQGCITCHEREAEEWSTSAHAASASNEAFLAALEREQPRRHDFCLDCHAPERRSSARDPVAEGLGVACVTCHVPLGAILASPGAAPGPHGVLRPAWFAGTDACTRCHQFDFPGAGWPIQDTVDESVELFDVSCQSCHMRAGGRTSHRFPGGYDLAFARRAVDVTASRAGDQVTFVLSPTPPHAVPTGDMFRRLRLVLRDDERVLAERFYGRRFERRAGTLHELRDDRLHATPRRFTLKIPDVGPLSWSLYLERVAYAPSANPDDDVIEGRLELTRGTLAP